MNFIFRRSYLLSFVLSDLIVRGLVVETSRRQRKLYFCIDGSRIHQLHNWRYLFLLLRYFVPVFDDNHKIKFK